MPSPSKRSKLCRVQRDQATDRVACAGLRVRREGHCTRGASDSQLGII
jgi:hypothetical protein